MVGDSSVRVMLGICTAILVAAALQIGQSVLAPIAFALFTIALVWPVQGRLQQAGVPPALALPVTIAVTLFVVVALAFAGGWGFSRVARWVVANAAQFQELYAQKLDWLAGFGIEAGGLAQLDSRWLVRVAQAVLGQLQGIMGFVGLMLVFVILGLLEVVPEQRLLARIGLQRPAAIKVSQALAETAEKLRTYMAVRTVMSVVTGLAVTAFAAAMGLELAVEWGVIAFVLNYIPFIGSFFATLFPTLFAGLQFGTWQSALTVFAALQGIQFLTGSTIEPWLTGVKLAMSPFMVLVAVFVGGLIWGIPGAFIGVPVLILALTVCEQFEGSAWVAQLLSGRDPG